MVSVFPNLCLWRRSLRSNVGGIHSKKLYRATLTRTKILSMLGAGYFLKISSQQEKQMCPSVVNAVRPFLQDVTVLSKNRVYFTASILTVQWLAHTLHEIVTILNLLEALAFNPICQQNVVHKLYHCSIFSLSE